MNITDFDIRTPYECDRCGEITGDPQRTELGLLCELCVKEELL